MATKPKSTGNSGSSASNAPAAQTSANANPPQPSSAATVAVQCSHKGFATVGITNLKPTDVIDFSRFDQQSCIDLGDAIVLCVNSEGFTMPAVGGTFDIMRVQGTQITFDDFTKNIAQMMKPKVNQ
jgi:hypothetical protein